MGIMKKILKEYLLRYVMLLILVQTGVLNGFPAGKTAMDQVDITLHILIIYVNITLTKMYFQISPVYINSQGFSFFSN